MATICFKAFSFLQNQLRKAGREYFDERMPIRDGQSVQEIIDDLGIDQSQVEAVFVNGRTAPFSTRLKDNDRLALVPPGTPGPYRVLLGIRECGDNQGE